LTEDYSLQALRAQIENRKGKMTTEKILVVDDEVSIREVLSDMLTHAGFQVQTAADGSEALELAKGGGFSVAIVDLKMPGLSGMETIQGLREIDPDIEAIVLTGHPSFESSVDAIRQDVFDYLSKPADFHSLERGIKRAIERRKLVIENRELAGQLQIERDRLWDEVTAAKRVIERRLEESNSFLGESEAIRRIRHSVAQVAPSDLSVLILGETGTGKNVVARLIHESSGRDPGTFEKINCPAIPEALLESELFGHEPGAFTGANRRKPGRFELASGGAIFLDEIGDLPGSLQSKLLQVLEQKGFTRLGGTETVEVNVRIIAATNAPIEELVSEGRFRDDVYYRLNEYTIHLPPLRERTEDIPLLARHFCSLYGSKFDRPNLEISSETLSLLSEQQWPGNVRELESLIRRFALDGDEASILESVGRPVDKPAPVNMAEQVSETEMQAILAALKKTRWNQRKAAEILKMSYSSLRRRIDKYGLKK